MQTCVLLIRSITLAVIVFSVAVSILENVHQVFAPTMPSCCATNCSNRSSVTGNHFHRFPTESILRSLWVTAVDRPGFKFGPNSCLCHDHFSESVVTEKKRLRAGAVPTIFCHCAKQHRPPLRRALGTVNSEHTYTAVASPRKKQRCDKENDHNYVAYPQTGSHQEPPTSAVRRGQPRKDELTHNLDCPMLTKKERIGTPSTSSSLSKNPGGTTTFLGEITPFNSTPETCPVQSTESEESLAENDASLTNTFTSLEQSLERIMTADDAALIEVEVFATQEETSVEVVPHPRAVHEIEFPYPTASEGTTQEMLENASALPDTLPSNGGPSVESSPGEGFSPLEKEVLALRRALRSKNVTIKSLKESCRRKENKENDLLANLRERFMPDQLDALAKGGNARGMQWSKETILKGLKLRFACGTSGYQMVSRMEMPLPSIRTLNERLQHLKFMPGVLTDVWELLPAKVESMSEKHRECMIGLDEMSVRPAVEYDRNSKQYIGRCTLLAAKPRLTAKDKLRLAIHRPEEIEDYRTQVSERARNEQANKTMLFAMGGVNARWKQNVAYHFTSSSVDGDAVKVVLEDILTRSYKAGLKVRVIVTDMGLRSLWTAFGIDVGPTKNQNWVPHPSDPTERLYIIPDSIHVFKNAVSMVKSNRIIILDAEIVSSCQLPGNTVDIEHLLILCDFQANSRWKLATKLTRKLFENIHFQKMVVSNSTKIFNRRTAAALRFMVHELGYDQLLLVTAWFIDLVAVWFLHMSCRNLTFALSKHNLEAYGKAREHLTLTMRVFQTMKVGREWKPCQTGLKSATQAVLDLADIYLERLNYTYMMPGFFTTDFVENEFSVFRMRDKIPTPLQVKGSIKTCTVSQFMQPIAKSSYQYDDRSHLLSLFEKKDKPDEDTNVLDDEAPSVQDIDNEEWTDPDDLLLATLPSTSTSLLQQGPPTFQIEECEKFVLYRVAGYILSRLISEKVTIMSCLACLSFSRHHGQTRHPYSSLLHLTNFREGALVEPSQAVFDLIMKGEERFILFEPSLPLMDCDVHAFSKTMLAPVIRDSQGFPTCHSLATVVIERFIKMRLRFFSVGPSNSKSSSAHLSSRTVAGHHLASNLTANSHRLH